MSPSRYRIVVRGELGPRYASAFDGMTIYPHDGETEITGAIIDPSHLQSLLERIAGLGLTLRSVAELGSEDAPAGRYLHTQPAGVGDTDLGANSRGP